MSGFPLLLIPLAVCNIIVFLFKMSSESFATTTLFTLLLPSGATWTVSLSDALLALGLFLLLLEVLKSARPAGKYVTDHLLALVIFAGAAAEFVLLPQFANATFFLLTMIALVDFLSGIGLRCPRRARDVMFADAAPEPIVVRAPPASLLPMSEMVAPTHVSVNPEVPPARIEAVTKPRIEPLIDVVPERVPDDTSRATGI